MQDDAKLIKAIRHAHRTAECHDYYCGCWDEDHTIRFIRELRLEGYELVEAPNGRP